LLGINLAAGSSGNVERTTSLLVSHGKCYPFYFHLDIKLSSFQIDPFFFLLEDITFCNELVDLLKKKKLL
jgi:hypothetical protein